MLPYPVRSMREKSLVLVTLAALLLSSCSVLPIAAAPTDTPEPTETPPPPTATATPTNTPTPTMTATPTTTATPTATPDRTATAAARATQTAAPILAKIHAEMKRYELSTDEGRLGWFSETFDIKVDTYNEERIESPYPEVTASDFMLGADVTWNTSTGLAGCALVVRAEDDFERGKQYRIYLMRLQGLPLWDIEYFAHGQFQRSVTGKILDAGPIDSRQGATNKVLVVGRENKLTVYANGDRLGSFTDSKLSQGASAFMAWQESGETTCTFSDAWLWVLKD